MVAASYPVGEQTIANELRPQVEVYALAYASVFKAPQAPAAVYEPRWTAWGGASAAATAPPANSP